MQTKPRSDPNPSYALSATFALFGIGNALFILDVATPLGVADGVGYAALLCASLWLPGRRSTVVPAVVYSVLIVAGHLTGHGGIGRGALVNRCLALVTLWVMAYVIDQIKQLQVRGSE